MKNIPHYSLQELLLENESNYSPEEKLIILNSMRDEIIKKRRIARIKDQKCRGCKELISCSLVFSESLCF